MYVRCVGGKWHNKFINIRGDDPSCLEALIYLTKGKLKLEYHLVALRSCSGLCSYEYHLKEIINVYVIEYCILLDPLQKTKCVPGSIKVLFI